ncbi:MAG: hypothetical protein ACXVAK_10275 [Vulcanimicrobiaceae bacterium]
MLRDYRDWLQSELQLLSNASHHAYAFGQANMAKRAIERLDEELGARVVLELERDTADRIGAALDTLALEGSLETALAELRGRLH